MDCETKMNINGRDTNGRVRSKDPNVTASFAELAHDVIELGELQAQLLATDIKCSSRKARTSMILAVIGICVLLGSVPVALVTVAAIFVEQLGWSQTAALGVATFLGIVLSAGFLAATWLRLRTGLSAMQRSREELSRNVAWIKASLRSRPIPKSETEPTSKADISIKPR
jgi:putative superfamily III holin-X